MNKAELAAISRRISTAAYVFDEAAFAARTDAVRRAFGEKISLCFSIKANPFLLGILPQAFSRVEICSPGEFEICMRLGIAPERIFFTGVNKTAASVQPAISYGVRTFSAESLAQLHCMQVCAEKAEVQLRVLLRLTAGSAFGMDLSDLMTFVHTRDQYPNITPTGLHYFSGTQKRKAKRIGAELEMLAQLCTQLESEEAFPVQELEYGTGLAAECFSDRAEETDLALLEEVAALLRPLAERVSLTVEMGRFFAAPCGDFFTRTVEVKRCLGVNYAICDGGIHQLHYDGQLLGMQRPCITHLSAGEDITASQEEWTLCGSLCTTADVLARGVCLQGLQVGDVLVFHRTGAYSICEGMALLLSRDLPAVYLRRTDGSLQLVRQRFATDTLNTPNL